MNERLVVEVLQSRRNIVQLHIRRISVGSRQSRIHTNFSRFVATFRLTN